MYAKEKRQMRKRDHEGRNDWVLEITQQQSQIASLRPHSGYKRSILPNERANTLPLDTGTDLAPVNDRFFHLVLKLVIGFGYILEHDFRDMSRRGWWFR